MSRWVVVTVAVFAARLGAQVPGAGMTVPEGYRPPPGMCRIWIDNVPADRQPAPTDCATAVRRRPASAKVIFGDLSKADNEPATASAGANGGASNGGAPANGVQPAHDQQAEPVKGNDGVHPPPPPPSPAQSAPPAPKGVRPAAAPAAPVAPPAHMPTHAAPVPAAQSAPARGAPHAAPPPPSPAPKGGGRPPSFGKSI